MKRVNVNLSEIADFDNLSLAVIKAARGKHTRTSVIRFLEEYDRNMGRLRHDILNGGVPYKHFKQFVIHDPKKRIIHAACFEDRVLHHGVMNIAGPVLDRAMIADSYACREKKGMLKAVQRVQHLIRRYPWYVKIDIKGYFDTIDHQRLYRAVEDKFKGRDFLLLMKRIIGSYHTLPGKGLPIGSLTSQHFANYYLDGLDRYIMETLGRPYVRYMDDMIWWCESREQARVTLGLVKQVAKKQLDLEVKLNAQVNRSEAGVVYCGFRIYPGTVRLGKRQLRRFASRRKYWESIYNQGAITGVHLQTAYSAVHAMMVHTDSREWRKRHFLRYPPVDV